MPLTLQHFNATTDEVAEKALADGLFYYPAICYVEDDHHLLWLTKENKLERICGYDQITDIEHRNGVLFFKCGSKILYAVDIALSSETEARLIQNIMERLKNEIKIVENNLNNTISNRIGDISPYPNVAKYIENLSYNNLLDKPIANMQGSLTKIITVGSLDDGLYRIIGRTRIGGNNTTIFTSTSSCLYSVEHGDDDSITITKITPKDIKVYSISSSGICSESKYLTDANLTTAIDEKLTQKLGSISDDDIKALF